jgi:hypothetical protein
VGAWSATGALINGQALHLPPFFPAVAIHSNNECRDQPTGVRIACPVTRGEKQFMDKLEEPLP